MTQSEFEITLKWQREAIKKRDETIAVLKAENEKMHTVSVELFNSRSKCLKYIEELEEKLGIGCEL